MTSVWNASCFFTIDTAVVCGDRFCSVRTILCFMFIYCTTYCTGLSTSAPIRIVTKFIAVVASPNIKSVIDPGRGSTNIYSVPVTTDCISYFRTNPCYYLKILIFFTGRFHEYYLECFIIVYYRPQHKRSLSGSKVQLYIFCCSKSPANIFRIINRDDLLLLYNIKGK